jgi:uncharacterized iron-regulated protein
MFRNSPTVVVVAFSLVLVFLAAACSAPGPAPQASAAPAAGAAATPIRMLENNALCFPADLKRIGAAGVVEDRGGRPGLLHTDPGTWVYLGLTPQGTVTAIVQHGAATPLTDKNFGAALEIKPGTHPADILPSKERMNRAARFSFTLIADGKPCDEAVRYAASRLGRAAITTGETRDGKGSVQIDAPGLWWITAEQAVVGAESLLASLTFEVSGGPGADDYAAFTSDGIYLDGPEAIADHLADADVIFLGEKHDDPVAHLLEKEILAAVHRKKGTVALTLEMFERDVQGVLDGYLAGHYKESQFLKASRPWPAYKTDYRPMVEYAKEQGFPVIAGNAPRRLVNFVTRNSPEELTILPEAELQWLPPLPYYIPDEGRYVEKLRNLFASFGGSKKDESPKLPGPRTKRDWAAKGNPAFDAYNKMLEAAGKPTGMGMPGVMGHGGRMPPLSMMKKKGGFPSQSLWDATMSLSISTVLDDHPGTTVVHVNGSFHSEEHLGTVEQLLRLKPDLKIAVVSMLPDACFPAFDRDDLGDLGDVVIVTNPALQPER